LAIFNLIPIPPLDGSKLLYLLIPKENMAVRAFLEHYSLFILFIFVFFGSYLLIPVISFLSHLFLGPLSLF
jgi:Zn-dependent protease